MADRQELPDAVKTRIVTELACYAKPAAVAALVKEEFGVEIPRQNVEAYDPEKVAGKALSKQWRDLFFEARKLYLADTASIGIANRVFRLRALERLFHQVEGRNPVLAINILEQAAKEEGGAFTNRRELTGKDGKPIQTEDTTPAAPARRRKVLDELAEIFGTAAALPGDAAARSGAHGGVVRKGARRRRAKKPGASQAS